MIRIPVVITLTTFLALSAHATHAEDLADALSVERLQTVGKAVDRGLEWLSMQQNADGSYNGLDKNVEAPSATETCYAVLAFLSRGHQPNQGRYGKRMKRAVDWLLSTQRPDGSFSTRPVALWPGGEEHTLTCLTLSEVFGATPASQTPRVAEAIEQALVFTRGVQKSPKQHDIFLGGLGYDGAKDDLTYRRRLATVSQTSRGLVFFRSAHNAGFEVPQAWIDEGLAYVDRCYQPGLHNENFRLLTVKQGQAVFRTRPVLPAGLSKLDMGVPRSTRHPYNWTNFNTTAAGILALALNNRRQDPMIRSAGDWLAEHSVPRQGRNYDFYYACYISSEAMSQVGGEHWKNFFPRVVDRLLPHQSHDGRWRQDTPLYRLRSPVYCTGLAVLTLTLPDQLLPMHQR